MTSAMRLSGNTVRCRHARLTAAAVFCAALCFSVVAAGQSYAEALAAKLTYKEGSVSVSRNGAAFMAVKTGQRLLEGDMVKTGKDAKATLTLNENSTINMGPESRLEIKQYLFNYDTEKRNVVVKSYSGKMRFVVSKIFKASSTGGRTAWNDSNFTVQTPTATAGIKGTEFVIVVSSKHTYFAVFKGAIAAKNISGLYKGEVLLGVNQSSVVKHNAAPKPASDVTPQQKQNLTTDTTPALMAKADTGSQGGASEKKDQPDKKTDKDLADAKSKEKADKEQSDKQESAKIAKDAAEGKKTGDIIDDMIDSGKNVDEAVALALKAGIDPATVIYAAIVKEYSKEKVVEGALEAGVNPAIVVKVAMDAGTEKKEIIEAANNSGLSETDKEKVPDIVAKYDPAGDPDVFGYPDTKEPVKPDVVYVPTDSYTIGGGGGAAGSTLIGSPTQ